MCHLGELQVTSMCHLRDPMEIWSHLGTSTAITFQLFHMDSYDRSNEPIFCRLVHGGHGAGDGAGHGAGDIMPPEWQDMSCGEIWRGMFKGQRRPPIDIKAANKMPEENMRQPATRIADDKNCNAGKPSFLLNEYKQLYIAISGSMTIQPPLLIACFVVKKPGEPVTLIARRI